MQSATFSTKGVGKALLGDDQKNMEQKIVDDFVVMGVPPVRVDLTTSLTGLTWDEAWAHRAAGHYGRIEAFFPGLQELVINKRTLARHRDLADLEALGFD